MCCLWWGVALILILNPWFLILDPWFLILDIPHLDVLFVVGGCADPGRKWERQSPGEGRHPPSMATLVCLSTTNWINIFCNLDKYCLQSGQIHFAIWTNTFCHLDKYILQSGQIHFAIRTNTFCNLDKYFLQFRQLRLLIASYQILPSRAPCYVFYTYILNCYNCTAQCTGLE